MPSPYWLNSHKGTKTLTCSKLGLLPKPGERCEFSDLAGERFIPYRQNIREVTANRYFEVERKVSDQRGDRVQQMERAEDE
jgi:hypothetical protein